MMKPRVGKRGAALVAGGLSVALLVSACSGGGGSTVQPLKAQAGPGISGLAGGLADFDQTAVNWNSYWYSRYNLGNLAMMSGLGVTFMPDMKDVMAMVSMVDRGPADGEHVTVPKNPALLLAVYAGGDPTLVNAFDGDPSNLANGRWNPAKVNAVITPSAQAQTILKEVEWAKFFNGGTFAGKVTDGFGAMDRFKGMALFAEAKMQAGFALKEMRNKDGLFISQVRQSDGKTVVVDGSTKLADQFQMLQALADIHGVVHSPERYNSVYGDEAFHQMMAAAADDLFGRLASSSPTGLEDLSLGAQALVWYAATTHDARLQQQALDQLKRYGDGLLKAEQRDAVERAVAIRGLIEAGRVTGDSKYLQAAAGSFEKMSKDYDFTLGYFRSKTKLTVGEVGDILGALNALLKHGGPGVDTKLATRVQVGFFEAAVNKSGLLQAVPPKEMEASPFELARASNPLYFAYPSIPKMGEKGVGAVDASEIAMNMKEGRWTVTNSSFDTAGAMHTSNEQNWTFGLVNGFPQVEVLKSAAQLGG